MASLCSIVRRLGMFLFTGILLSPTVDAAQTLRVALISAFSGSDLSHSRFWIDAFKNFSVPYINNRKAGIPYYGDKMVIEVVDYDWQSNASLIATCVRSAHAGVDMQGHPVGEIHMIVAATSTANEEIIETAQSFGIPSIHTSGGNPLTWKAENTFAFGMHLPFIWYTRGPIRLAQTVGLKRVAIIRSAVNGFFMTSGIAAMQWARESGLEIVGPSKQWCLAHQNRTRQCRIVTERCVCGDQADVDSLGFEYDLKTSPTFYELDERLIGDGYAHHVVDNSTTDFVRFMVEDWRAQNVIPDVVLNFAEEYHDVLNALKRENFAPQMLVGWHSGTLPTWSIAQDDQGNSVLGQLDGLGAVGFGQWHSSMAFSDPVFGSNSELVKLYADANNGAMMGYNEAGAVATAVATYIAVSKYLGPRFGDLNLPAKRDALRGAIGQLDDETMWGLVRFNRFHQNSGRGTAAWQVQFDSKTPEFKQRCILPIDAAEAPLAVPFPSWGARFGCTSGHFNALTKCMACPSGKFNNAKTVGLLSLVQHGIDAAQPTECSRCEAGQGTMPHEMGQTHCRTCPLGFAQDGSSRQRGICRACRPGSYRDVNVSGVECSLCHAGTFSSSSGAVQCTICPQGTYQIERGQRACICKVGFYKDPLDTGEFGSTRPCLPCDTRLRGSSTRLPGATRAEQCDCGVGSFLYNGECKLCDDMFPKGTVDCQGFGQPPVLNKGHMTLDGDLIVFDCPGQGEGCLGGVPVGTSRCSEGASGINCASCDANWWYEHSSGKCKQCGGEVVVILLAAAILAWIWLCIKLRPVEETFGATSLVLTLQLNCIRVPMVQVVELLQLFTILHQSEIRWPTDTGSFMSASSDFFGLSVLSLECFLGGDDKSGYAFRHVMFVNLLPAILILVEFLVSLPYLLMPQIARFRPPSHRVATSLTLEFLATFFVTIMNFAINLVFSLHAHTNGVETLAAFPHIRSTDTQTVGLKLVALFALAIWCVGSFALIIALLYVVPRTRNKTVWCQYTLALFVRYADDKSYWIVVDMMLKACVTISISVFDAPDSQMQWIAIAYLLYLVLAAFSQPYRYKRHWISDIILTKCKITILIFSSTTFFSNERYNAGMIISTTVGIVFACISLTWAVFDFFQGHAHNPARDAAVFSSLSDWLDLLLPDPINLHELVPGTEVSELLAQATLDRLRHHRGRLSKSPETSRESLRENDMGFSQNGVTPLSASNASCAPCEATGAWSSMICTADYPRQVVHQDMMCEKLNRHIDHVARGSSNWTGPDREPAPGSEAGVRICGGAGTTRHEPGGEAEFAGLRCAGSAELLPGDPLPGSHDRSGVDCSRTSLSL